MLGLLFVVLGVVAIVQGGANRVDASIDEAADQGLAVADGGVNQALAKLISTSDKKALLLYNYDSHPYLGCTGTNCNQWAQNITIASSNPLDDVLTNSCNYSANSGGGGTFNAAAVSQDLRADSVNLDAQGKYTYKILGYRYDATGNKGTLFVKGKQPDSSNNTNSKSVATVQVEFPVNITKPPGNAAALIAKDVHVAKDNIYSDAVMCTDKSLCNFTCTSGQTAPTFAQLAAAIDADNGGAAVKSSSDPTKPAKILVGAQDVKPIPPVPSGATVNQLGDISMTNLTLPQPEHSFYMNNGVKTYYYQIGNLTKSNIQIGSITDTTTQYRVYISGNIDQTGNDDVGINSGAGPAAAQIRIFGGQADVTGTTSNGTISYPTNPQSWEFGGNACTTGFIWAPYADIGVSGGGNGCSGLNSPYKNTNFFGGIWAKSFGIVGNDSNAGIFYEQPGTMNIMTLEFPDSAGKTISPGSVTQWTTKQDPEG
jgi:hypothetical protein